MKKIFLLFLLFFPNFLLAQDFPIDKWKIIYHSYTDYTTWDSHIFIYDLKNKTNQNISKNWKNVYNSMNAHISPDWKNIVFMWINKTPNWENWDIYLWDFISQEPLNLTSIYDKRNEDPKFSPDWKNIVFKQWSWNHNLNQMQYDLKILDLNWNIVDTLTNDIEENSMPYYTYDWKNVIYSRWVWDKSSIYILNLQTKQKKLLYDEKNIQEYYPIALNEKDFYYTSWEKRSKNDQIYLWDINSIKRKLLSINRQNYDFSDPYPINYEFILFSSNYNSNWWYDLYLWNINTWEISNLSFVNTNSNELWGIYLWDNIISLLDKEILEKADKIIEKYKKNSVQLAFYLNFYKENKILNKKQKILINYLIKWFKK